MEVLLINSPLFENNPSTDTEDSLPPLGLGYIGTPLKSNGIKSDLVDTIHQNLSLLELTQLCIKLNPKYICINIFSTNFELVKKFIETYPQKDIHFIIGGYATRHLYQEILNFKSENKLSIVIGEGDLILLDIVTKRIKEPEYYNQNNRVVYRVNRSSIYFPNDVSKLYLDRSMFKNDPLINYWNKLESNIITGRGCYNNCSYCSAARSRNHEYPVREKSKESIILEIGKILEFNEGIESIRILDDLFLRNSLSINKAIEIFKTFNLFWRSMAHINSFTNVKLKKIEELQMNGCYEIFMGIDSGSPRILDFIHKTSNINLITTNLSKILASGINIKCYFIYGFPEETEKDMKLTYNLACRIKELSIKYNISSRFSVFQFRPYHGTELYDYIKNKSDIWPNIGEITHNSTLTSLTQRTEFNFSSGNYSFVELETLHEYIYKTQSLNDHN